jgi:hypothetical protein
MRAGAKFCTSCGTNQMEYSPVKTNSSVKTFSTQSVVFNQKPIESWTKKSEEFTLSDLMVTELEIEKLSFNVATNELQNQLRLNIENYISNYDDKKRKIDLFLTKNSKLQLSLSQLSWKELKEKIAKLETKNIFEIEYIHLSISKNIINNCILYLNEYYKLIASDINTNLVKSELRQKEDKIKKIQTMLLKGINNFKNYSKVEKNLLYFIANKFHLENNISAVDEVIKKSQAINEIIIKLKQETANENWFSYDLVLSSIENDQLKNFFALLSSIQNELDGITLQLQLINFDKTINLSKDLSFNLGENLLENFLFSNNSFSMLIESNLFEFKNLIGQFLAIKDILIKEKKKNDENVQNIKDYLFKIRQEFLMNGIIKSSFKDISVPELEKRKIKINYISSDKQELSYDRLLKNSYSNFKFLSDFDLSQKKEEKEYEKNKLEPFSFKDISGKSTSQSVFRVSVPKLPKLSSMNSLFLKTSVDNEIKKELQKMSYSFKKIRFDDEEDQAECSYYTGLIKRLYWIYKSQNPTIEITAVLNLNMKNSFYFELSQDSIREKYSWENPYSSIMIKSESESIHRKILREKRIAEKFKNIPGSVNAIISNETITMTMERNPDIVRPVSEFLNEITFILNLSFRY